LRISREKWALGWVNESVRELRGLEEVVVARGAQSEVGDAAVVDQDIVKVPEIDGGKLLGKDLLNLCVKFFARVLIDF